MSSYGPSADAPSSEEEERAPHERQVQRRRYEESPLIVLRKVIQGLAEPV